jgi:hypothetical protein
VPGVPLTMRTRTRTTIASLPAGARYFYERNTTLPTNPWQGPYSVSTNTATPFNRLVESMVDEQPKLARSGSCSHSKVTTYVLDAGSPGVLLPIAAPAPGQLEYRYYFSGGHLVHLFAPTYDTLLAPNASVRTYKWREWSFDAIQKMRPSLADSLLLLNSLSELVETGRGLRASYEKRKRAFEARFRRKRWQIQGFWALLIGDIRRLISTLAELNLFWQFMVRPTLSDAKALADLVQQFRSRCSELIRQSGKVRTAHYARRADVVDLAADTNLGVTADSLWTRTLIRKAEWTHRPDYHASMVYTLDASKLQGALGSIEAILYSLGVTKPLSIIWEAIPFSFVVDWFVRVGDWLSSLEDTLFDPLPIVIHDFSHSVRWSYRNQLELTMVAKYGTGKFTCPIATRESSFYERRRETPSTWDALSVRTPSLNQVGLGLSLIVVKMDGIPRSRKRPKRSS